METLINISQQVRRELKNVELPKKRLRYWVNMYLLKRELR
jgi:hypothetical protein